jgi:hypothetical protein
MTRHWIPTAAVAMLTITGCARLTSTQPLAKTEDSIFDPALVGTWTDGDQGIYSVKPAKDRSYEIDCTGKNGEKFELNARLTEIRGHRILDVWARQEVPFGIAGHAFFHVANVPDGLEVRVVGSEWLVQQIENTQSPAYFRQGSDLVITASTEELREFVSRYGLTESALEDPEILRRR